MADSGRTHTFWTRLRRAIPTILLAILGTFILSRLGILHGIERLVADAQMAASPERSEEIRVVNITDEDYDTHFGGLPVAVTPSKLHDLIDAIASSGPAVIAVDIDTSHRNFKNFQVDSKWPTVIWERDLSAKDGQQEGELEPLDVLGGQSPQFNANSGIPQLLDDPEDKVTRLYTRCVETKAGAKASFVYAIVMAYRASAANAETAARGAKPWCAEGTVDGVQPFFVQYSLRPESTLVQRSAGQVLALKERNQPPIADFAGKIVLVGGMYRDFDRHSTPIGSQPGIAVLANAIQTELKGTPVKAMSRGWLFLVELVSSTILVVLFTFFPLTPTKLFAYGLLLSAAISLGLSYLSFHTISRFASFAPTLLAVVVFEVYEHVRHESILKSLESGEKKEHAGSKAKP